MIHLSCFTQILLVSEDSRIVKTKSVDGFGRIIETVFHISLHKRGPLKEKLHFLNHAFKKIFDVIFNSAKHAFKNFLETVPFSKILNFLDISSRSKFGLEEILFSHIG